MRQKLNENPVAQIAIVAVLAVFAVIFLLKPFGGGGGASEASTAPAETVVASGETTGSLEGSVPSAAASGVTAPAARPLPGDLGAAYSRGETVVLLIYRSGGIDDDLVTRASNVLSEMSDVALFTAPTSKVARYSAITGPLGVNQTPALIVVRPRALNGSGPAPATVDYGFRSAADIRQAVVDVGYRGPELTYAPN